MPTIAWRDRVQETTTTEGLGNLVLAGAVAGFQSFATAYGADTNGLEVTVEESEGPWECLEVNYVHASQTLVVVNVLSSSTGSKVNWGPGTRLVYVTPQAGGVMSKRENLAGLPSASEARSNLGSTTVGDNLFTAISQAAGRSALGLGSLATINSPLPLANGGTGATTAANARTNLELGTVATRNVGTGADQVPDVEDADARYLRGAAGTKMVFYQASAPTGWTQDTSANDRVLRVVSGSGGSPGGNTWIPTGLTVSGATDGHALTVNEMPAHTHGPDSSTTFMMNSAAGIQYQGTSGQQGVTRTQTASTGGGAAHSHTLTGVSVGSTGTWRPPTIDVIVATKD